MNAFGSSLNAFLESPGRARDPGVVAGYDLEANRFWYLAAGKIGNAFFAGINSDGLIEASRASHFDFFGHSFTIRFWALGTGQDGFFITNFDGSGFEIGQSGHQSVFPAKKYTFGFSPSVDEDLFSLTDVPVGVWHRVICSYDHTRNLISIRINNDGLVSATPHDPLTSTDNYFRATLGERDAGIDELGFWRDYVWSEADCNYDWNSGAGSDFARSKSIGNGPYAYYRLEEILKVGSTNYAKGEV